MQRVNVIKILVDFLKKRDEDYKAKGFVPTLELLIEDLEEMGLSRATDEFLEIVDHAYAVEVGK